MLLTCSAKGSPSAGARQIRDFITARKASFLQLALEFLMISGKQTAKGSTSGPAKPAIGSNRRSAAPARAVSRQMHEKNYGTWEKRCFARNAVADSLAANSSNEGIAVMPDVVVL